MKISVQTFEIFDILQIIVGKQIEHFGIRWENLGILYPIFIVISDLPCIYHSSYDSGDSFICIIVVVDSWNVHSSVH